MTISARDALRFVRQQGIVLESAHGRVPNLVAHIAGEEISGNWWGHPKAHDIFAVLRAVRRSRDVLVCRLVDDKITFVDRRLWPALARLSRTFDPGRLASVAEIHTPQGKHVVRRTPFAEWVSPDVLAEAAKLTDAEASRALRELLDPAGADMNE